MSLQSEQADGVRRKRECLHPYSILTAWKMDMAANQGNYKSQLVLSWFRLANVFGLRRRSNRLIYWIGAPVWMSYRIAIDWIMSIEIPPPTRIAGGLRLDHGQGLVIHADTVIGEHCLLRHNTTIGCAMRKDGTSGHPPVLGDYVEIGSNAVVLGDIEIGTGARIGAGSVVLHDVPDAVTVAGNPARVLAQA